MKSWNRPEVPQLPGRSPLPRIYDTARAGLVAAGGPDAAAIYVCGITPYDATHLGHAATYLAYDTLIRVWTDRGLRVSYVQNTTDVDDPLLERATATGVDWRDLAAQQTDLFRSDMEALRILPPDHYIAVTEMLDQVAAAVRLLLDRGIGYQLDADDSGDIYFDNAAAEASSPWHLGDESHFSRALMLQLSAERGGDPERPGKRDPLDPLLWRGARPGEPSWPSVVGPGRPGWHIECSVIAAEYLDLPLSVKAGGADLVFPHHEFSAGHTAAVNGVPLAEVYSHAGMVAYEGEKMSKSLGNLVRVSELTDRGVEPAAIRLALLAQHYREDWEWTAESLERAEERLARWRRWAASVAPVSHGVTPEPASSADLLEHLREALSQDLATPRALATIDEHIAAGVPADALAVDAIDALLGIRL